MYSGLPFGVYELNVAQAGFAPATATVEIRLAIVTDFTLPLKLPQGAADCDRYDAQHACRS